MYGINRLKKVQGKKKRDVAARESARAAEQGDNDVTEAAGEPTVDDEGGGDLLSSKDEDVIF
jgi:V-type H+-transporting ATPase subunit D